MATFFVYGVEKIRIAPAVSTEAAITTGLTSAIQLEDIVIDSTAYTQNADTTTDIFAEDKDGAVLTIPSNGEPDQITIGLLQQKPTVLALLENIVYTPATTKIITLAKRKVANLMIEITTRSAKDDRKQIIVLPNVFVTLSKTGNLTKTGVEQLLLTGKVGTFTTTVGALEATSLKTWVTVAGAAIDSTIP